MGSWNFNSKISLFLAVYFRIDPIHLNAHFLRRLASANQNAVSRGIHPSVSGLSPPLFFTGGLSEEIPSVFKTRSKLRTHLSTQCSGDERQSRPCPAVNRTPDLWCRNTRHYHSILFGEKQNLMLESYINP
ncbi:hypothetical protein TNCV_4411901 [Trichonephila clavipes]|nr:hypothetical protein TNCV_4411901 [Trichonephila clavipes]